MNRKQYLIWTTLFAAIIMGGFALLGWKMSHLFCYYLGLIVGVVVAPEK